MKPHTTRLVILACLGSMLLLLLAVSAPFGLRASHAYFAESARQEQNQIFLTPTLTVTITMTPTATINPTMTLTATAASAEKITLCHIPPGNADNAHTITIGAASAPAHLNHGDTLGACPATMPTATATPPPPPPPTATPPSYPVSPTGTPPPPPDTPQPPVKITICHRPPGNPDKAKTITVGEAAVDAHLAHGDTLGACP